MLSTAYFDKVSVYGEIIIQFGVKGGYKLIALPCSDYFAIHSCEDHYTVRDIFDIRCADEGHRNLAHGAETLRCVEATELSAVGIADGGDFHGGKVNASKRFEYLKWAAKGQRYIVEDDFESEFSVSKKPEESLFSHTTDENVIYMNTFSKTISPALRVGYMILPEHLVTVFEDRLGFYSCTVPTFIQLVLARLIENGDFERQINRVRRQKRKEIVSNGHSHE